MSATFENLQAASEAFLGGLKIEIDADEELCDRCDGYGFIREPHTVRYCSCRFPYADRPWQSRYLRSVERISKRLRSEFENSDPSFGKSPRVIEAFAAHRRENIECNSIVILGSNGLGKSHAGNNITRKLMDELRIDGVMIDTGFFGQQVARMVESEPAYEYVTSVESVMFRADLAVFLDDLGAERTTSKTGGRLAELIENRHKVAGPTIVTTNLSERDIDYRYGSRFASRFLNNPRWMFVCAVEGDNLRLRR